MKNVGTKDRIVRLVAALPLATYSIVAPPPLQVRLIAFALPALYFVATALFGTCVGYALVGKSTRELRSRSAGEV